MIVNLKHEQEKLEAVCKQEEKQIRKVKEILDIVEMWVTTWYQPGLAWFHIWLEISGRTRVPPDLTHWHVRDVVVILSVISEHMLWSKFMIASHEIALG